MNCNITIDCPICNKTFTGMNYIGAHMVAHFDTCGKQFINMINSRYNTWWKRHFSELENNYELFVLMLLKAYMNGDIELLSDGKVKVPSKLIARKSSSLFKIVSINEYNRIGGNRSFSRGVLVPDLSAPFEYVDDCYIFSDNDSGD